MAFKFPTKNIGAIQQATSTLPTAPVNPINPISAKASAINTGMTGTPPIEQPKMTVDEFATKIKTKYPAYKDLDNRTLTQKVIGKYPVYANQVETRTEQEIANERSAEMYKPSLPYTGEEKGVGKVLKPLVNIPSSAFNLGKGLFQAASKPVETAKGVGLVALGAGRKIAKPIMKYVADKAGFDIEKPEERTQTEQMADMAVEQVIDSYKERYGDLEKAERTVTNDPVGFALDVLGVLEGGAGVLGKTKQLNTGLQKVATLGTKGVGKVISPIGKGVKTVGEFGLSQATGLEPKELQTISKLDDFSKLKGASREQLAENVFSTIKDRMKQLGDLGEEYKPIREAEGSVGIKYSVEESLKNYGLNIDKGKIIRTPDSRPITKSELSQLQDFYDLYSKNDISKNAFLNARDRLSQMAKFEQGKSTALTDIAKGLRKDLNEKIRPQVEGLKELDVMFAPERKSLKAIEKDYFKKDGGQIMFKDNALSKLANLTGKGKEQALNRLKAYIPDIEEQVDLVRALEGLERAKGQKVGTYTRAAIGGGAVAVGNIPLAIGSLILTNPEFAARIINAVGKGTRGTIQVLDDINNFRLQKFIPKKAGLSIELVDDADNLTQEARKYKTADEFVKAQGGNKLYNVGDSFEMGKIVENPFKEGVPSIEKAQEINKYLQANKDKYNPKYVKFYHGTAKGLPIEEKGLLPTSAGRRKSYQSESGYVYLANTPERAKTFGDLGNMGKSEVYEVVVPINKLLPDLDQLNNLRSTGEKIGNTLGESIVYGGGVRIKGKIEPYAIRKLPDDFKTKSQLTDIWNKANKTNADDALIQEARKYKSAEEIKSFLGKNYGTKFTIAREKLKGGHTYTEITPDGKLIKSKIQLAKNSVNNTDTILHEFGHLINESYKEDLYRRMFKADGLNSMSPELPYYKKIFDKEMEKMDEIMRKRGIFVDDYTNKVDERLAEFVRLFSTDRELAQRLAPQTTQSFRKVIAQDPILTDFYNQATKGTKEVKEVKPEVKLEEKPIPKELEPLAKEARKYKSAEEFVKAQTKRPDYGYGHSPNEDGVPAFDLTAKVDGEQMIPKDMYTQWYGSRGTPEDLQSISALKKIKGNPEADITIYRAGPKNEWNYGDWITLSKKYAETHAEGNTGFKVFSKVVKAKDLKWAMDDVNEFGYFPESTKSQLTDIWEKANKR